MCGQLQLYTVVGLFLPRSSSINAAELGLQSTLFPWNGDQIENAWLIDWVELLIDVHR
jgi:hypothetical protein